MLRGLVSSAVLAFVLLPAASAANEIGKIENSAGGAVVLREGKVLPTTPGTILQLNDIVRTEPGALLRLVLNDGSSLLVNENTELRVALFDMDQQQTLVEMLHGRILAEVAPYTKPSGRFVVRTPTASVLAIGTKMGIETTPVAVTNTVTRKQIDELPLNSRSFAQLAILQPGQAVGKVGNAIKPVKTENAVNQPTSLRDIPPGAKPGETGFWLGSYAGVGSTLVTGLDHSAAVMSVNPSITGMTFVSPGGTAVVGRDQAPQSWGSGVVSNIDAAAMDLYLKYRNFQDFGVNGQTCTPGVVVNGQPVSGAPNFTYKILGMGGSTGWNSLQITVKNLGSCPVYFFVPAGTGVRPKGFNKVGKAILGLALGTGMPDLKSFQDMETWGILIIVHPAGALGSGPAAATGGEVTAPMRSYCVELHKLAPHPQTEYKFAKEDDQKKFVGNLPVLKRALELYQTRQLQSPLGHGLDSVIQWSLWAKIEKLGQKEFMEEFTKIVHKNYEAKKQKWDKETQKKVEASGQDLWKLVQIVLK